MHSKFDTDLAIRSEIKKQRVKGIPSSPG